MQLVQRIDQRNVTEKKSSAPGEDPAPRSEGTKRPTASQLSAPATPVTVADVKSRSLSLNWEAPSNQTGISYRIFYSTDNNISTVESAQENGIPIGPNGPGDTTPFVDKTSAVLNDLPLASEFWFTIVAYDQSGNTIVYEPVKQAMPLLLKDPIRVSGSYELPELQEYYSAVLTEWNGLIYFTVYHHIYGSELWVSDGTPNGTHMFKDLKPWTWQ